MKNNNFTSLCYSEVKNCSFDWSVMFVVKHCIFLLLDFIVLRYGHRTSVFSDEPAWVCHSALSSLLCVGVSEGNVYLLNVRANVYVYLSACTHVFRWPQGLLRVHWTRMCQDKPLQWLKARWLESVHLSVNRWSWRSKRIRCNLSKSLHVQQFVLKE